MSDEPEKTIPKEFADLPDDLWWMAENQGTPYLKTTCHMMLRDVVTIGDKHERDIAEIRHFLGTRLTELITHGAVTTLGRPTVGEFLEGDCGIPPDEGYEYIRFSKGATEEQAKLYRFSRCRVGITLAKQLERKDLAELAKTPFDVTNEHGATESVAFTPRTPVSKLRWALKRLRETSVAPAEPEEPSRTVARRMRQLAEIVDDFVERHPELQHARVRVTLYAREARVQHDPLVRSDEFAAISKLYDSLAKVR